MNHRKLLLVISAIFFLCSTHAQKSTLAYTQQKKVVCTKGAVVSAHPLASKVGLQILKQGGNSFDAVVATQLALAVVYPNAGNIGGGGFLVAHLKDGKNISIDYREKASGNASKDMYLDKNGEPVPKLSEDGHLAAAVPGTIAGLFATMKYAKLPFKKLIQPAIQLAEKGYTISKSEAINLNALRDEFIRLNTTTPAFVKKDKWKEGDLLIQKDLAATLKRISENGIKGFYEGETARLIVEEMKKGKGIINYDDLKNYEAVERVALEFNYKDVRVVTMPLPSSGGIILQQLMKIIEKRNIASMGFLSANAVQLMVEAERRVYADRAEFLGDPDFIKMPLKIMTGEKYLEERMKDFVPGKAGSSTTTKAGLIKESEETTHISIIDEAGNAVAVTTTLNDSYGSKTVVSGAGFLLNNEMDDFSIKPGVPNMYGAIGNEKNAIMPNKRMLSSMTPTIVLKDNKPFIIVGSPGGTTIPTSVFQSLVDLIEFTLSPYETVNKPKFHHQWLPDLIYIEESFPADISASLQKMGYTVEKREPIGRTELIRITYGNKRQITAIADNRGDDSAAGY